MCQQKFDEIKKNLHTNNIYKEIPNKREKNNGIFYKSTKIVKQTTR